MVKRLVHRWFRTFQHWGSIGANCNLGYTSEIINEKYMFLGPGARIGGHSFLACYDEYNGIFLNPELRIGSNFFARENLTILCAGKITIGNEVTLAGGVFITNENHGLSPLTENYRDNPLDVNDIEISDGVWIGEKVCILPGVKIGKKAIIGAGAVVTKDVPDYSMAVGNPARVIKRWHGREWK